MQKNRRIAKRGKTQQKMARRKGNEGGRDEKDNARVSLSRGTNFLEMWVPTLTGAKKMRERDGSKSCAVRKWRSRWARTREGSLSFASINSGRDLANKVCEGEDARSIKQNKTGSSKRP